MATRSPFAELTRAQGHAFFASLAGWALDAFDFFLFVFAVKSIAGEFHVAVKAVAAGIFWTLAMRPVGALLFGYLAERHGRRPILMVNVVSYSLCELASAAAPNLTVLLVLRGVFGVAMGGEWGVGAALALESLPAKSRGFFSGLLQEGYVLGYLLASVVFKLLFDRIGWRGMFVVGAVPALLVLYIRGTVDESPAWLRGSAASRPSVREVASAVARNGWTFAFLVLMMACFNALSHGSQDLYPTYLQVQRGFDTATTGSVAIVFNIGALCGGITFGTLSERIGRRRAIALAAALVLPAIPLWTHPGGPAVAAVGAFVMQFMVQGAWGVVPAHLNELSPSSVRAILPGLSYQLGNLAMATMAPLQAGLAESRGNDYGLVLSCTVGVAAAALAVVTLAGRERKHAALDV